MLCGILMLSVFAIPVFALNNYDVYVLVHEPDGRVTWAQLLGVLAMLRQKVPIKGVMLSFYVYDNSTSAINEALTRLESYIKSLQDYQVILQPTYRFEQYGYIESGQWKYPRECFSPEFYQAWYGNLSALIAKYPTINMMVGFNEAYLHFANKEDARAIMKLEYQTWKRLSRIPFSCETTEPYEAWMTFWNVTGPDFEADVLPIWADYSDYIGFQLWADRYPLTYGVDLQGNLTAFEAIYRAKHYADQYGKPIHINELPAWHQDRLDVIADLLCHEPNKICIYKLWDYDDSSEYFYALYLFDHESLIVKPNPYSLNVFKEVFAPKPTRLILTADAPMQIARAMIPVVMILAMLSVMKRTVD